MTDKDKETRRLNIEKILPDNMDGREKLLNILLQDWRFLNHPSFKDEGKVAELFTRELDFDLPRVKSVWCKRLEEYGMWAEDTLHLNIEDEKTLFLRMNYAKMQVSKTIESTIKSGGILSKEDIKHIIKWSKVKITIHNAIVVANLNLIFTMGGKMQVMNHDDIPDSLEKGLTTLNRAINGFDVKKKYKFSTYACVGLIRDFCRYRGRLYKDKSRFVSTDFDNHPYDLVETFDFDRNLEIEDMKKAMASSKLTDRERLVLKRRFWEYKGLIEIGKELGVSKERIRQIQEEAMYKIKAEMTGEEFVIPYHRSIVKMYGENHET